MKRSLLTVLLVVLLIGGLFFLTGCGEKKEESKPAENTSTTTTENNQTATAQTVDFYVQNLVPNTTIKELYASPAGSGEWSPNLLGGLEMATGTQAQIGIGVNNGSTSWDLKAVDEECLLYNRKIDETNFRSLTDASIEEVGTNDEIVAYAKERLIEKIEEKRQVRSCIYYLEEELKRRHQKQM